MNKYNSIFLSYQPKATLSALGHHLTQNLFESSMLNISCSLLNAYIQKSSHHSLGQSLRALLPSWG